MLRTAFLTAIMLTVTTQAFGQEIYIPPEPTFEVIIEASGSPANGWEETEHCIESVGCAIAVINTATDEVAKFDGELSPGFVTSDNGEEVVRALEEIAFEEEIEMMDVGELPE